MAEENNIYPEELDSLKKLHNTARLKEDLEEEINILKKIITFEADPEYIYRLGCAYILKGEEKEAFNEFEKLIPLKEAFAHAGFAWLYELKKDYKKALESIKKALKLEKAYSYHLRAGIIYEKIKEPKKALREYLKAFKLAPYSFKVHNFYIECLMSIENIKPSKKLQTLYSYPGYNLLSASFYRSRKNYKKSEKYLSKVRVTHENTALFHLYKGLFYVCRTSYEQAIEEFEISMSKDEFRGVCAFFMANIYDLKNDKNKAGEMIFKVLSSLRYTGPVVRSELFIMMWEKNLIEQLEKLLPRVIWSLNFDDRFISSEEKEKILEKLNEINSNIREKKRAQEETEEKIDKREEDLKKSRDIFSNIYTDLISFEAGRGLICLIKTKLLDYTGSARRGFALESGITVPALRFRDNLCLKPNEYIIKVKNVEVARGEVFIHRLLAVNEKEDFTSLKGLKCFEPAYKMPAIWISPDQREKAEQLNCMVLEPESVIISNFIKIISDYRHEFLTRDEVKRLIDNLKKTHPAISEEVCPRLLSFGEIQKVLKNLAKEKVSIRDLPTIFETLGNYVHITKNTDHLTEYVRQSLSRSICTEYKDSGGVIKVIKIEKDLENFIAKSIVKTDYGSFLNLNPAEEEMILNEFEKEIKDFIDKDLHPVVLCSPQVRLYLRGLTERLFPEVTILSYNEIAPKVNVDFQGEINLTAGKKDKDRYLFSYIEKMSADEKAVIRREAIKALGYYANENNMDWITYYIDRGLEDKHESVRYATVKLIRELYERKLKIF